MCSSSALHFEEQSIMIKNTIRIIHKIVIDIQQFASMTFIISETVKLCDL